MMRFILALILSLFVGLGHAKEIVIAIVDMHGALLASDAAKVYAKKTETIYQPKLKALSKVRDQIQESEDELRKNAVKYSKEELEKKQNEIIDRKDKFVKRLNELRTEKEQADQKELMRVEPLLEKAVQTVSERDGIDIVLDRPSVVYNSKASKDITEEVIKALNKLSDKKGDTAKETKKK